MTDDFQVLFDPVYLVDQFLPLIAEYRDMSHFSVRLRVGFAIQMHEGIRDL